MANNPLVFNTDGMRGVANQITNNANQSLDDHTNAWYRMQNHLQSYPSNLHNLLFEVINPHQERLSQTYHWQLSFASALHNAADQVDEAEAEIAQWF